MKKLKLISLSTYCHRAKTWDKNDILIQEVQKEDLWNHPWQPMEIPEMKYTNSSLKVSTGLWNFFKAEVNKIVP